MGLFGWTLDTDLYSQDQAPGNTVEMSGLDLVFRTILLQQQHGLDLPC